MRIRVFNALGQDKDGRSFILSCVSEDGEKDAVTPTTATVSLYKLKQASGNIEWDEPRIRVNRERKYSVDEALATAHLLTTAAEVARALSVSPTFFDDYTDDFFMEEIGDLPSVPGESS